MMVIELMEKQATIERVLLGKMIILGYIQGKMVRIMKEKTIGAFL